MKVTVFVLTCERPADLKKCLDSLQKQALKPDEILVINNGKDQETDKLLSRYKVRVIKDSTKRLSYLFNLGWRKAQGEIIGYLADDTRADPGWLESIIECFKRHPGAGVVTGPVTSTIEPAGEMHRLYLFSQKNWLTKLISAPYFYFVMENQPLAPGKLFESGAYSLGAGLKEARKYPEKAIDLATTTNMGIKKSALKRVGGFDERFNFNHADGDLFIRLKKAGFQIIFDPKISVYHHIRPGPSRFPYFIGLDTGLFIKKHIRPRTLRGLLGFLLNLLVLKLYWLFQAIKTKNLKPLSGIWGLFLGFLKNTNYDKRNRLTIRVSPAPARKDRRRETGNRQTPNA